MEIQETPIIVPNPPSTPPLASSGAAPTPNIVTPIVIAVVATLLLATGVFVGITKLQPTKTAAVATPTPAPPTPTPTPIREPSLIASSSAFLQFQANVATLSAVIAGYNPQDSALTPPSLVLPLGFTQN